MISRVRQIPVGESAEDVMRNLKGDRAVVWLNYKQVMEYLYEELEKDPEIGGIIGYSEGAAMASTFILDEQRREKDEGRPRRIKCAIFVTGWPPMSPERGLILADEHEDMIDVPSLHVLGANGKLLLHWHVWHFANPRCFRSLPPRCLCPLQRLRSRYRDFLRHRQRTHHPAVRQGDHGTRRCGP